jgi:hypothetical protein
MDFIDILIISPTHEQDLPPFRFADVAKHVLLVVDDDK